MTFRTKTFTRQDGTTFHAMTEDTLPNGIALSSRGVLVDFNLLRVKREVEDATAAIINRENSDAWRPM